MALTGMEFAQGALTLITVLVSVILGISIMTRFKKSQVRGLILVGLTWILLVSGYWPDAIHFILQVTSGTAIDDTLYLVLATAFYAPIHVMWLRVITELLYKDHQKTIMGFFWVEAVIYEMILVILFIINPALVGQRLGPFYAIFSDVVMFYYIFSLAVFIVTGVIFARFYLKSASSEIRRRGYFLLVAFFSFLIGITLDNFVQPITEVTLVIARLFHVTASIEFFLGFYMRKIPK